MGHVLKFGWNRNKHQPHRKGAVGERDRPYAGGTATPEPSSIVSMSLVFGMVAYRRYRSKNRYFADTGEMNRLV
ncbi:MAG: PEP-CTERM sorting domain-containing protein [Planctomycetota bacterium]